ncbi:PKD-like family lipoprotein [Longitalea luteola]|uniref:PKD-like family lipoprotein n=1 Tax=Longitalea luteola TaxID=2812563 RepID=UPI001A960844|nr:PKD-like family lipoprotein [Longitalea luteola]
MKQTTIYSLLFGLFLLSSCYKDKGNYDYAELNKVTILFDGDTKYIRPRVSDTLNIDPQLVYKGDTLRASKLAETFAFTWYCNNEQISSSPVLHYPVRSLTGVRPYLKLKVVNKNDGSTFLEGMTVEPIPAYLTGWVVLTKKDNRSIISFIDPVSFEVNADFYATISEKELGPNAVQVKEIWMANAGLSNAGNILIVRNDAGGNIELDGIKLNPIANSNNFFLGNTLPPDFRPRGEFYMWDYTIMLDDNRNIYVRKHVDNSLTQSGVYPNKPLFIPGGVKFDQGWDGTFLSGQTLLYDKTQGRLFLASDDWGAVLPVTYLPGPPLPPGTTLIHAMDKELVYVGRLQQGRFTSSYYLVFFDGTKYYEQKIMIMDQRFTVNALFMGEVPLGAGTANAQSVFCQLPRIDNYMFYSGGSGNKTLYLHEQGPGMSSEYFTFDSPIKIIAAAQNQLMGVHTHDQLMVALENGHVYILGILPDQMADPSKRLIKKIELNQGVPVSGMYKMGYGYFQM